MTGHTMQRGFQVYRGGLLACSSDEPALLSQSRGARLHRGRGEGDRGVGHGTGWAERPGRDVRPSRPSVGPLQSRPNPNDQAARVVNNGALPKDLSLMVKAREGGPDYVYSLMTGFKDTPPADITMAKGMYYDEYFPGRQIAMPPPLQDGRVTYADGTKATLQQEARDVATFLAWAAEPKLEDRHRIGARVVIFLLAFSGVMYGVKRKNLGENPPLN